MSADPVPAWRRMATNLAVPAFLVVSGTFVAARLLDVRPWTAPAYDVWAYWLTRGGLDYAALRPGDTGAFLYSPAFAQALAPLVALPWPLFAALWTAVQAALLLWLTGRHALPVLFLPPVALSVLLGQLDLAFAIVTLIGLRWPMVWALPLLTKVTPGVGLVWFLVRGEWRSLAIALGLTGIIAGASYLADPQAWSDWIGLLRRREFPELGDGLIYLPVPIWLRLPLATLLVAWGARTDRRWVLPVGVCLALPTIWLNSPAILVALLPLAAAGASTPAGAWLRRAREPDPRSLRPLPEPMRRGSVRLAAEGSRTSDGAERTMTVADLRLPLLTIDLERLTPLPDGRIAEWEALGDGTEPLVWVEGGPGLPAHLARADVVPVLDRFRCHLVNAPGSGRSTPPATEAGYGLEEIVGFFEAWRRAIGLGSVTLMGHSWGGLVAPAWAALHPEAIQRLIVISGYAGAGSVDAAEADAEQQRAIDRVRDRPWFADAWRAWEDCRDETGAPEWDTVESFRGFLPFYFAEPEDAASVVHIERIRREVRVHPPINDAWIGAREDADYRPLLAGIRCPTLVITGEHDWICGPVWSRSLANAIPGARLVELAGVGHLPQYEAPATFRAVIDAWL